MEVRGESSISDPDGLLQFVISDQSQDCVTGVIDIQGDRATGLWYLQCPVIFTAESPLGQVAPGLIAGRYQEEYVREDGVWKWSRIVALLDVMSPTEKLWADATLLRSNR
jgi:hypothetical protein